MAHRAELQSQVRALAHLLAHGQISWADYRERRAAAVRRIVRGDEALAYDQAVIFGDAASSGNRTVEQVAIDVNEIDAEPRRWPAVVAVAAFLVVATLAGWVIYNLRQPPVTASAPVVDMAPAEAMLAEFREAGDWSAASIEALVAQWRTLSPAARADARASLSWRRLQSDIRQRINEQQALKPIDESGEAAAQEARLIELRAALAADQVSSS